MKVHDPVCGREMAPSDAAAFEDREGWVYFFCSPECRDVFRTAPAHYTQDPLQHRSKKFDRGG